MKSLGIDINSLVSAAPPDLVHSIQQEMMEEQARGMAHRMHTQRMQVAKSRDRSHMAYIRAMQPRPKNYWEEVIIRRLAPVYRVKGTDVILDYQDDNDIFWGPLIEARSGVIAEVLPSVGRVEARLGGSEYLSLGTAWVTEDGLMVTNRHVARFFAQHGSGGLIFRHAIPGPSPMDCRIDFSDEPDFADSLEIPADGILFLSKEDRPDIAVLQMSDAMRGAFRPLKLHDRTLALDDWVAAIGFPEHDERARKEDIRRVYGDVFGCKRFAPGFIKSVTEDTIVHQCSTLGGNSGSPIIELKDGRVAGIHFGGFFDNENYAEPAATIRSIIRELTRQGGSSGALAPARIGESEMSGKSIKVTIPITITVDVGQPADSRGALPLTVSAGAQPAMPDGLMGATLTETVSVARKAFGNYDGVVHIRAGWKFRDGWITDEPAVVISVREKKTLDELKASGATALPERIGAFVVDVKPASPFDVLPQLREDHITEASIRQGSYQRELKEFPLDFVKRKIQGSIHVGPDAGSQMLREFLGATEGRLTVGMYEFTAPEIVRAVTAAVGAEGELRMVLQKGEHIGRGTKKDDQPDEQTVAELSEQMGSRFDNQWASIGAGRIFPWAYHIKVAVRDGQAVWLSSGSWQSSNQPPFDRRQPDQTSEAPNLISDYNREWHVILNDEGISGQFEKHILQDAQDARQALEAAMDADPVVWIDSLAEHMMVQEAAETPRYFPPLAFNRIISVGPLLTPDNYPDHALELIRSAKKRILFQNQSFNIAVNRDERFTELLDAMKEKQAEIEDVRIIIRGEFAREQVEKMKSYGFDVSPDKVRLQNRCHAKTLIVDDRRVLIGSHNFTDSGTTANRDASLLFDDRRIAEYCSEIYEYDWERSRASVREPRRGARTRIHESAGFEGMVPVHLSGLGLM